MKHSAFLLVFAFIFTFPLLTHAAIVPCNGVDCDSCSVIQLVQNIINFFIQASAYIVAVIFAWGGLTMTMSGGEPGKITEGKTMMTRAVIGFVIILSSWLIVNTLLHLLAKDNILESWNEIQCSTPNN